MLARSRAAERFRSPGNEPAVDHALRALDALERTRGPGRDRAEWSLELIALHRARFAPPEAGPSVALPALEAAREARARARSASPQIAPEDAWLRETPEAETAPDTEARRELLEQMLVLSVERAFRQVEADPLDCGPCLNDASCSDGVFCNGSELCTISLCAGQIPRDCSDDDDCTADVCNETSDRCDHILPPPPPEVALLRLDRADPGSPVATLSWDAVPEATEYNVYRGQQSDLVDLSCFAQAVPTTEVDDDGALSPGGLYVHLVSSLTSCRESGLGDGSGLPRPAPPPCP